MAATNPTFQTGSVTKLRIRLLDYRGKVHNKDIALACGMHPTRLSEYASGKKPIPVHHLMALCGYFNCGPQDILGEAEDQGL